MGIMNILHRTPNKAIAANFLNIIINQFPNSYNI